MEVCCAGSNCSKREQCKVYENNYWEFHDSEKWAQYDDWSRYGNGYYCQNEKTGEILCEHEYWCGDLSKDYKFFKEIPNK